MSAATPPYSIDTQTRTSPWVLGSSAWTWPMSTSPASAATRPPSAKRRQGLTVLTITSLNENTVLDSSDPWGPAVLKLILAVRAYDLRKKEFSLPGQHNRSLYAWMKFLHIHGFPFKLGQLHMKIKSWSSILTSAFFLDLFLNSGLSAVKRVKFVPELLWAGMRRNLQEWDKAGGHLEWMFESPTGKSEGSCLSRKLLLMLQWNSTLSAIWLMETPLQHRWVLGSLPQSSRFRTQNWYQIPLESSHRSCCLFCAVYYLAHLGSL